MGSEKVFPYLRVLGQQKLGINEVLALSISVWE